MYAVILKNYDLIRILALHEQNQYNTKGESALMLAIDAEIYVAIDLLSNEQGMLSKDNECALSIAIGVGSPSWVL